METHDPAAILLGKLNGPIRTIDETNTPPVDQARLLPFVKRSNQGKRMLNLSGSVDKLVHYRCGEAFVEWLRAAAALGSWFTNEFHLENVVFDNVGHQISPSMVAEAIRLMAQTLHEYSTTRGFKSLKI